MSTLNDLLTDSEIKNGMLAPGEVIDPNRAQYGMREINRLLDQWNVQPLFIWTTDILTFNLTARVLPTYWFTIGPAGGTVAPDFAVPYMPTRIIRANLLLTTTTPNARVPMGIFDDRQWSDETVPALGTTIPNSIYYDYGNTPNGQDANGNGLALSNMYVWPYPTVTQNKLELFVPKSIARFVSVNDTFTMPTGYEDALMMTVAERTIEGIREIPATLRADAARARAAIRGLNSQSPKMSTTDSGMPGRKTARGSFYDGWSGRR